MERETEIITLQWSGGSYDIYVGRSLESSARKLEAISQADHVVVVAGRGLMEFHAEKVKALAEGLGCADPLVINDIEAEKSYAAAGSCVEDMLSRGLSRKSLVVAVGGGITGDFAGFCSALYMRGIPFVQMPTTLLAMVDASIGGKVAVNLSAGKNIAGAFHQPAAVFSDIDYLVTLDDILFAEGLTESLKHGLLGDSETMSLFRTHSTSELRNPETLLKLVALSARFKADIVMKDEREGGLRALLNLGHTVGHAIEAASYRRGLRHGQAVALGLLASLFLSVEICGMDARHRDDVTELIIAHRLLQYPGALDHDSLIRQLSFDKKKAGDTVPFVLLEELGKPVHGVVVKEEDIRRSFTYIEEVLSRAIIS